MLHIHIQQQELIDMCNEISLLFMSKSKLMTTGAQSNYSNRLLRCILHRTPLVAEVW